MHEARSPGSAPARHGRTNQQIGAHLKLSPVTIRNHLNRIYRKFGVTTRTQAAVRAVHLGLSSTGQA